MNPLIGKPVSRLDGKLKVTGAAKYAGDYFIEGLAHAVVFESEIAAGKIKSFDFSRAKQVQGLIEIVTHENAPSIKTPKSQSGGAGLGEKVLPLQDDEIRYNGQFIGVVIAETLEAAEQAAKLVKVNYKSKAGKIAIDQLPDESYELKTQMGEKTGEKRGDTKKALKNSDVMLDLTYSTPIEHHNPMEPSATVVELKGDELLVYDANQGVSTCADLMGQAAKAKKTQVIAKFIGGGFGCKGSLWNHQFLALLAAKKVGRPIKLVLTRQQMFTGVGHRASTHQEIKLGATSKGELLAIEHVCYSNTAIDKEYAETATFSSRMLYQCDNVKTEQRIKKLNYQSPTFMRAPGESSGSCAMESALDELAAKLKMDPIELRIKNYAEKDQHVKKPYSSKSLKECYKKGAEHFAWSRRQMNPRSQKEGSEWIGYGMATATYPANRFAAKVSVEITPDGKAKVRAATQDIGTGSWTIFTELAAQELNIPPKDVDLDIGDSLYPKGSVSGGSSTASSVGAAIQQACEILKKEMYAITTADEKSPLYKADKNQIEFVEGKLQLKNDSSKTQSLEALMKNAKKEKLTAEGETKMQRGQTDTHSTHAFGAQFVEVRVNELTGEVRLVKMTGAFASGRILNAKTARSQYMGGMIFGIGMGLMEETRPDLNTGRLTVKDLADYHFPVNADVPQLDIIMVEEKDDVVNSIGTKGIGEIGIVGAAAAIANAVYNATGVRVRDFPLTPEKVLAGLKRA